jgi:hypothetical protein
MTKARKADQAALARAALDSPDLPPAFVADTLQAHAEAPAFVADTLQAHAEAIAGQTTPNHFGGKPTTLAEEGRPSVPLVNLTDGTRTIAVFVSGRAQFNERAVRALYGDQQVAEELMFATEALVNRPGFCGGSNS